jgi:2-methylisocitrate lyase-like PEP mutase family enzyme
MALWLVLAQRMVFLGLNYLFSLGFKALYISGAAVTASSGVPDIG